MSRLRLNFAIISALLTGFSVRSVADEKADGILREAFGKMQAARTMTARLEMSDSMVIRNNRMQARRNGTIIAMKPNYLRVEFQGQRGPVFVSDGKFYYMWANGVPTYTKEPAAARPVEFPGLWEGEIDGFFGGAGNVAKITATYTGTEKVDGVECDIIKGSMKDPPREVVYAIGKTDRLIRRSTIMTSGPQGQTRTQVNNLKEIKFNVSKTPADFQFKPPPYAKPQTPRRRRDVITVDRRVGTSNAG